MTAKESEHSNAGPAQGIDAPAEADAQTSGTGFDTGALPASEQAVTSREIGGRDGPDPTRFGDWEKNGRCIDF